MHLMPTFRGLIRLNESSNDWGGGGDVTNLCPF